jgi:hypothetical protein
MGEGRDVYRALVGKPEGKRSLERSRHRWNNIKTDFQEVGRGKDMDWIDLAQDWEHVAGCCECGDELSGSIKCGELLD